LSLFVLTDLVIYSQIKESIGTKSESQNSNQESIRMQKSLPVNSDKEKLNYYQLIDKYRKIVAIYQELICK